MDSVDITKLQLDLQHQINTFPNLADSIGEQQRRMMDSIAEANEERIRNEEEKRDNLRRIADNSEETVNSLKETNKILNENNQLLREKNEDLSAKLQEILNTINMLVDLTKETSENQEEMMKQALSLAVQLNVTTEENGKTDWKAIFANTSVSTMLLGLQLYLKQHGLF